jgi:hypothetical protein
VPVVHLSVHPSAWASTPPSTTSVNPNPPATTVTPPTHAGHNAGGGSPTPTPTAPSSVQYSGPFPRTAQPGINSASAALPAPTSVPGLAPVSVGYLNYVAYQHSCAVSVLRFGRLSEDSPPSGLPESKNLAKQLVTQWGYQWPSVFDEEFPPRQDEPAGIKYELVTIEWVATRHFSMTRILICVTVVKDFSGSSIHPRRPRRYKRMLSVFWSIHLRCFRCQCRLHRFSQSLSLHRPIHTFLFMSMRTYSRLDSLLFVFGRKMQ